MSYKLILVQIADIQYFFFLIYVPEKKTEECRKSNKIE